MQCESAAIEARWEDMCAEQAKLRREQEAVREHILHIESLLDASFERFETPYHSVNFPAEQCDSLDCSQPPGGEHESYGREHETDDAMQENRLEDFAHDKAACQ